MVYSDVHSVQLGKLPMEPLVIFVHRVRLYRALGDRVCHALKVRAIVAQAQHVHPVPLDTRDLEANARHALLDIIQPWVERVLYARLVKHRMEKVEHVHRVRLVRYTMEKERVSHAPQDSR
jgi:hypothetical protein